MSKTNFLTNSEYKLVSIVIPCFNEEEVLVHTLPRLIKVADNLTNYDVEFIFIDDGSNDKTINILRDAAKKDLRIKVIRFARNFGHQIAVTAGIDMANGHAVALIDADLQDPPEILIQMISHWEDGYDVIYGVRSSREGESIFKTSTAHFFYRFLNYLSETPIPLDTGDFRLMDRKVVDILSSMPERHRFVRGLVSWVGHRQMALPYERKKRAAGKSKYPLIKMLRFATDGILSFSSKPLQISTKIGIFTSCLSLIGIFYALVMRLLTSDWVEGWTTLLITFLFIGGVQLISIGIIGEYIGRIYEESKNRPLYLIQEYIGSNKLDNNRDNI